MDVFHNFDHKIQPTMNFRCNFIWSYMTPSCHFDMQILNLPIKLYFYSNIYNKKYYSKFWIFLNFIRNKKYYDLCF